MSPTPIAVAHSVSLVYFCPPNNLSSGHKEEPGEGREMAKTYSYLLLPFYHIVQMFPLGITEGSLI